MNAFLRLLVAVTLSLVFGAPLAAQTVTASGFQREDLSPQKAFDDDPKTRWSAPFDDRTAWIEVTYDAPREFSEIEILNGIADAKGAPRDFRLLAGEAGSLKEVFATTGNTKDPFVRRFSARKARVWRLEIDALINARWSPTLSEIRLRDASGAPVDAPSTVRPTLKSSPPRDGEHAAAAAFDGDRASYFEGKAKNKSWIELTYEEPQSFDALGLDIRARGGYGVARDFRLRARVGSRWKTVLEAKGTHRNRVRLTFKPTTAARWRFEVQAVVDDRGKPRIGELMLRSLGKAGWPKQPRTKLDGLAVNQAIDRGAAWLVKKRADDGNWKTSHTKEYPMGVMSLVGMAIRKSGAERDDPLLQSLVKKLEAMPLDKTYSVALYAMFLKAMSTKRYGKRVQACADFLVERQAPDGLWGYPTGRSDLSNAQYALLALKAARACGAKVPNKPFQKTLDWLIRHAQKDGGFNYVPHGKAARDPATGSMTAAALACFDICLEALPKDSARRKKAAPIIKEAFAWIDARFTVTQNPNSPMSHYYWLYGVERVGAFYDRREIGGRRWYPDGAMELVDWQKRDGSWHGNLVDTCFALLFLNRASVTGN